MTRKTALSSANNLTHVSVETVEGISFIRYKKSHDKLVRPAEFDYRLKSFKLIVLQLFRAEDSHY